MAISKIHPYFPTSESKPRRNSKVAIIGTGQVGMAIAYTIVIENIADSLVLVDALPEKAQGEVMDLLHGLPFVKPMSLKAGTCEDCAGADLVIITAGAKRKPGDSRLDLMKRNTSIFQGLIPSLVACCPDAVFLIVSNPVDVMTYAAWKLSGLPPSRVIGSGTILDTARFRSLLSERLQIDPRNVHAYIIGEHGDSEVAVWSRVNVSGVPLKSILAEEELGSSWDELAKQVKNAAMEVIKRKGATCYAIGLGVIRFVEAVLRDQQRVMTASCLCNGAYDIEDVCLSLPVVIGREGINRVLAMQLNEDEEAQLHRSAKVLRESLDQLGL